MSSEGRLNDPVFGANEQEVFLHIQKAPLTLMIMHTYD